MKNSICTILLLVAGCVLFGCVSTHQSVARDVGAEEKVVCKKIGMEPGWSGVEMRRNSEAKQNYPISFLSQPAFIISADPLDIMVEVFEDGGLEFTAMITKGGKIDSIRFYNPCSKNVKKFTKRIRAYVKDEELRQKVSFFDAFVPSTFFAPSDAKMFLEEHLMEEGVKGEEIENYGVSLALPGIAVSQWRIFWIPAFEKRYRTLEVWYYDKRMVLEKLSQCQPTP